MSNRFGDLKWDPLSATYVPRAEPAVFWTYFAVFAALILLMIWVSLADIRIGV
jgi:hypothetical protein